MGIFFVWHIWVALRSCHHAYFELRISAHGIIKVFGVLALTNLKSIRNSKALIDWVFRCCCTLRFEHGRKSIIPIRNIVKDSFTHNWIGYLEVYQILLLLLSVLEHIMQLYLPLRSQFRRTCILKCLVSAVEFKDCEFRVEWSGLVHSGSFITIAANMIDIITMHHSLGWWCVSESTAVKNLIKIRFTWSRSCLLVIRALLMIGISIATIIVPFTLCDLNWSSVVLDLHLGVQAFVHIVLITLMNLIEKVLVIDTQELVLE